MLELPDNYPIEDQLINEQSDTLDSTKKSNVLLKLVISNPSPLQETSSSQETEQNKCSSTSFMCEVRLRGPCLYEMKLQDPSHYLACDLILEVEECRNTCEGKRVICYFPTLSGEELSDFVEDDKALYTAFMIQFQMKVLEQLLLFCATHYAPTLVIYADDTQADNLDIYQDFLALRDETLTSKGEKTEMVIPTDQKTLSAWVDFMQEITADFRQALWRNQSSNPIIRQYLKDHPLG